MSNYTKLVWAEMQLRLVAKTITPSVAPKTAAKVRSAIKSIGGAIRHADGLERRRANR